MQKVFTFYPLPVTSPINVCIMNSIFSELGLFKSKKADVVVVLDCFGKPRHDLVDYVKQNFPQEIEHVRRKKDSITVLIELQEYTITLESLLKIKIL